MNLKSIFNSLSCLTSSSSVTIVQRTHFNGKSFVRIVDIEESAAYKARKALRIDKLFPLDSPHKLTSYEHRFTFQLDLANRPIGKGVADLMHSSGFTNNYTAFIELRQPFHFKRLSVDDDGLRTFYIGYKLCDWLEIGVDYALNGQLLTHLGDDRLPVFPVSYEEVCELNDDGNISLLKNRITIGEHDIDNDMQNLVKQEARLFLEDCLKMMTPA